MDNLILEAQNRIKNKRIHYVVDKKKKQKNPKYISNLFTRTLLSVILVLACAIYINISDANLLNFKNYFFNDTLAFTKINNLYSKYFGNIVPDKVNKTIPVASTNTNFYTNIEEVDNSYKLQLNSNTFSFLESGIIVFSGEKEGFGKTIIVQGIDGVDIWYSNLDNTNVTIYDYVEKGGIVGECKENTIILTFMENGEYKSYENYLS